MEKNLVSIITPVYNGEKYIEKCIESVLNQTYKNLEMIIVDDGSIDNSENIIKKYTKENSFIKYIKLKENSYQHKLQDRIYVVFSSIRRNIRAGGI